MRRSPGFAVNLWLKYLNTLRRRWNRMFSELLLAIWSCAGLTWWFMAWRLVATADHRPEGLPPKSLTRRSLSIFKPLPPLGARGLEYVATGLESFLAQLDDDAELSEVCRAWAGLSAEKRDEVLRIIRG